MQESSPPDPATPSLVDADAWAALDALGVGVTIHAPGGEMLHTNAISRRLQADLEHGVRHSTVASVEWNAIRPDGSVWAADELPLEVTRKTGVPVVGAIMGLPGIDGERRWLNITTRRLRPTGPPCSVVVTVYDVTAQFGP